ncbi:MAG: hypothetical protein E6H43_03345 [Betaproteobacteria bacterium]|nr:MAG: hypothetical protein E6H43_03345 [Betaproteobacteria bacterium]TMI06926.1 MAG: hypothetical protein E6H40_14100 [Betaproteobacteria bacterium]
MLRSFFRAGIACATMSFVIAVSVAIAAPSPATRSAPVYRLSPAAAYTQGCFPPALCPVMFQGTVRGTMALTPIYSPRSASTMFDYRVDDVNWLVRLKNDATNELRVTGSGVLHGIGPFASRAQRLELDLTIEGQPVQHFDSGWVQSTVNFPQIDLTVSIHMMVGFDMVFRVAAAPVPATEISEYHVDDGSTHQVGCWSPCECPVQSPQPMTGKFALVPIRTSSATEPEEVNEYAVVNVRWNVLTPTGDQTSYQGFGFYRRNVPGPWANPLPGQRMFLDLRTSNSAALVSFDSGVVPTPAAFPNIDIAMSIHGLACFDTLIHLEASPIQ